MKFLKITDTDGDEIYINPALIVAMMDIHVDEDEVAVTAIEVVNGGTLETRETAASIADRLQQL